jgi:YidC/Oxa1 family membrane protein insertase
MSSRLDLATITLLSLVSLPGTSVSAAEPMTRDGALATSHRIAIDSPTLRGSIALKGGRIDDLALTRYHETVNPLSPVIVLLSPPGSPQPYYAEFGWVDAAGSNVKVPGPDTDWRQEEPGALGIGQPVTLVYDNAAGLIFRRTISVDDKYLFTIKDEVKNGSTAPVTLSSYALVFRHGIPQGFLGLYISHEGLIGMFGDKGLQTETYSGIERRKAISYSATDAWLGMTDRYWATALVPNTDTHVFASFEEIDGTPKGYQAKYLLDAQTIPPRGSGSADTRLFAGAKEVATLDRYTATLHLNKLDLLIDWGGLYFIYKPTFLVIDFFFRLVHNYGIAILLFTVLVQLLFFPLANKTYATVAKRRAVRPLGMSDHVNPLLRGLYVTILLLVQFSLYKVLFVTVEMRHAPFLGWIDDLSAPDPTNIFNPFESMPFEPTTVPVLGPFLHLGIWPAIMCVTMWVLIKLNRAPVDPTQKVIFNWMPIIVGYSLAGATAGLLIYRACHSSLSLLHQSLMIRRYGAKVQLLDDLRRTFAKPTLSRSLAAYLYIWRARGARASMNVPISIRILRWVRRTSRITFWLSAILLLISGSDNVLLAVILAVTAVLSVVTYLIALRFGQVLAAREFAAAVTSDTEGKRPIILFLRSFGIARSSLSARFILELGYIVRYGITIGFAALVGDTVGFIDRRYEVEENLDNAIGLNAMFVAIGDRLASYGAAKITVKEEDWQKTFYLLANSSQLIFMMPGPSASLLWELSQIVQSPSLLEKAVFIMPRGGKFSLVRADSGHMGA